MKKIVPLLICAWMLIGVRASANTLDVFNLTNLDGQTVELADFRGKVVLVNFWASWCPPCVHELPSMQALYDGLSDEPFEVIGLNMAEDPGRVQKFLTDFDTKLTFPILLHADRVVAHEWKVKCLPTTVIFDKNGERALTWQGPKDWNSQEVRDLLQPLLQQ